MKTREIAAGVGASLALGVGIGIAVESHTNEVANGKITTANTCLEIVPHESTINQDLLDCLEKGVPGGNSVDQGILEVGQPIEYVDSYISSQHTEAAQIEPGRLAGWSLVPMGCVAVYLAVS